MQRLHNRPTLRALRRRVTMRYARTVEESKRAAVDAVQLNSRKNVHAVATWPKQPQFPAAVSA